MFGGGSTTTGYTYSASVIMALCEGPIAGINQIWKGQSVYTLAELGLSLFTGTTPQSAWSYVASAYPSQALAYQGTAYVCAANYDLGDSATLDNHNFEVQGFCYGSRAWSGIRRRRCRSGADRHRLSSPMRNTASAFRQAASTRRRSIGSGGDASYQTYCRAVGLALSPALTDQEQASSILARWLQLTNTAAVWSGGLLRFIPYGDSAVTRQRRHVHAERDADLQSRPTTTSRSRTTRIRCRSRAPIRTRPTTSGAWKSPSATTPTI